MTRHGDHPTPEENTSGWGAMCRVAAAAAVLQFVAMFTYLYTGDVLPSAAETFAAMSSQKAGGLRYGDFTTLVMVGAYAPTALCVWRVLRRRTHAMATVGLGLVLMAVLVTFATHPGLSMIHLHGQYEAATTQAQRQALVVAGDAALAMGTWNSTGGFMAGLGLQGGAVILAVVMLGSRRFSRFTAITMLAANGLDLIQHLLGGVVEDVPTVILAAAGLAYVPWFPSLARDLWRLGGRGEPAGNAVQWGGDGAAARDQAPPARRPAAADPSASVAAKARAGATGR